MHRGSGSQLIYNRESRQSLFFGALTAASAGAPTVPTAAPLASRTAVQRARAIAQADRELDALGV